MCENEREFCTHTHSLTQARLITFQAQGIISLPFHSYTYTERGIHIYILLPSTTTPRTTLAFPSHYYNGVDEKQQRQRERKLYPTPNHSNHSYHHQHGKFFYCAPSDLREVSKFFQLLLPTLITQASTQDYFHLMNKGWGIARKIRRVKGDYKQI